MSCSGGAAALQRYVQRGALPQEPLAFKYVQFPRLLQAPGLALRVPVHQEGMEERGYGAPPGSSVLPDGPAQSTALEDDHRKPDDPRQSHFQGLDE